MKYSVKYWMTKQDYDKGEAISDGENLTEDAAMYLATELIFDGKYAVEVYETESGETFWHSKD